MAESAVQARKVPTFAWWLVLGLVGLDYFSTLAYLPSIAVEAAGRLAPLAAAGVILITILGALPVYLYVVGRSPHGQGATGLLERLIHGWFGKTMILVLLGFVATDFVITRSLSVADASTHIIENPFWHAQSDWVTNNKETVRQWFPEFFRGRFFDFWNEQLLITLVLTIVGFAFWWSLQRGFTRIFMWLAAAVVFVYLLLTGVVAGSCLYHLGNHPQVFQDWMNQIGQDYHSSWQMDGVDPVILALLLTSLLAFPQMALGLSGFELSTASAPLIRGGDSDNDPQPRGRIRNARKLTLAAALIMSVFVPASILAVTLLVPETALKGEGKATHRALAYLAHGGTLVDSQPSSTLNPLFGPFFGTIYDGATILILCLAGASVTISLRNIVPNYLSRFGMQLQWAHKVGVILHLFNVAIVVITLVFRASVSAQQWAYATSVLVLLTSASIAALLDLRSRWHGSWLQPLVIGPFVLISALFLGMAALTTWINRSGLKIALAFVAIVLVTALLSRWRRSTELRFQGFAFADEKSKSRWNEICRLEFQVLIPHRPGLYPLAEKNRTIRKKHRLGPEVPIIFIEAEKGDPSDFFHMPFMRIDTEDAMEIIRVSRCASIPHVIAAIGLEFRQIGKPPEIYFDWSNESPLAANFNFLLMGEGNIPWMVHELIRHAEPEKIRQPRVVIG